MVKKTIPKITPKKGDSDSDFVDSPPKTSNFSHASTSRYPIRSKDNSKGKQRESIGVVDKKIKKRVISVEVARRRRIIDSEDEEDDDDRSEEPKVLVCNRKESVQKTVRKKKNAKIGKGRRREVVESVVDNRVLKEWDYYVPKGLTFTRTRFSTHVNTSIVELLKLKLSSVQLDMFRKTVFGHFLDMKPFFVQNQVLCYLMRKELVQDRLDKFYVDINGSRLCFGIEEFAAVTGLKCDGDVVAKDFYEYSNRLKRTYFPNRMNVGKNQLANCFLNKKWNSDEDAVKIAVLYFIFTFLLSAVANRNFISDQLFYLVESGEYMSFPWGKKAFLELMESIRDKMFAVRKFHRFGGFPLALQIWLYECCSDVNSEIAICIDNKSSRILNWKVIHDRPKTDFLKKSLFKRCGDKVFRNFLDSSEEIQVKSSKCGSDLIDKVEEQKELNQRREMDVIQECKLVKDDGEDIILRNGIEKLGEGFSSLKKYVEDSFASLSKDKAASSDPINLQHHKKCSLCDAGRDVECPKEFVLRSEFEKLSSEFNLFKKLVEQKILNTSVHDDTNHESGKSYKKGVDDEKYMDDDIDVSRSNEMQNNEDVIQFENSSNGNNTTCQFDVVEKFEDMMVLYDETINQCKQLKEINSPLPINIEDPVIIVDDTPMPSKRVKTLGKLQRSPFVVDFDSVEDIKNQYDKRKIYTVKYPFNESIDEDVDYELMIEFSSFVDKWALKGRSRSCVDAVYQKGKDILMKAFVYGDQYIKSRDWFHRLNYGGRTLNDTHIDVIFYYLRKLYKYDKNIEVKFTTTNFLFGGKIQQLYKQVIECNMNFGIVTGEHEVANYVLGSYMACACPWYLVDHVLMPIFVEELAHWVLGIFTINDRVIHVYDSMRGAAHDCKVLEACKAYAVLIPHLLYVTGFYMKKQGVAFDQPPYSSTSMLNPLDVAFVDNLPTQKNLDCGVFVSAFAEYFIRNRQFPIKFDVDQYRSRLACLLWNYGLNKQKEDAESESEFPKRKIKIKDKVIRQQV
ncbi:hypothetical protein H5410_007901 [Solanum commersonii]|uniref:Ubiquitin-like protease family profile domain-containing protein n=1 Tax=Solanum commersonii TaxID=4109 RepID=A0A9J6AE80_SOLCO|nr:hypothetical protein H5410_007901 [Solanum commersonii]